MVKSGASKSVLVLSVVFMALLSSCIQNTGSTNTLGGRVRLDDGSPLGGVEITLRWPEGAGSRTVLTDKSGWYSWEFDELVCDLPVTLTPAHPGYEFEPPRYELPNGCGDFLELDFVAQLAASESSM